MYRQGPSGLGLDRDQTNLDGPWQSQSRSQNFCLGPDCPVFGPAKMAWDRTRPNFPNTSMEELGAIHTFRVVDGVEDILKRIAHLEGEIVSLKVCAPHTHCNLKNKIK